MAESATPDSVNRDETNVDYAAALEMIQTTVHGLESEQRSLSADAKDAWDRIEALGVNKVGAQSFSKILKKPVEKRRDEFRTFVNLAKAAGWFEWLDDLVDRSQRGPVTKPVPTAPQPPKAAAAPPPPPPPAPEHPADQTDLAEAGGPAPDGRVNLKKGWIQRVKDDSRAKPTLDEEDWEDVRQATPAELAAERERIADFDDAAQPAPDIAGAKTEAAAKVGGRRQLKVVGGTGAKK